ncbi:MAG: hypothetical protein ACT4N2_16130 [Hyphomicrobium sp.]
MASNFSNPRNKPAVSPLGAGMSEDARKAMNGAFDALSNWRNDIATVAEKNSSVVFDRMGAAAKAMGWPAEFVDMTRQQMQSASKMQLQMMDQLMDVWEQQMKSPGSPIELPKLAGMGGFPGAFAGMGGAQSFPGFPGFDLSSMPGNPMMFWMQAAEMWQKSWQQGMAAWMDAVQSGGMGGWPPGGGRR